MIVMNDISNTMIREIADIDAVQLIDDKQLRVYTKSHVYNLSYKSALDASNDRERLKKAVGMGVPLLEDDDEEHNAHV